MFHRFSKNSLVFLDTYLKRRKQGVKINEIESSIELFYQGHPKDLFLTRFFSTYFFKRLVVIYKRSRTCKLHTLVNITR